MISRKGLGRRSAGGGLRAAGCGRYSAGLRADAGRSADFLSTDREARLRLARKEVETALADGRVRGERNGPKAVERRLESGPGLQMASVLIVEPEELVPAEPRLRL